MKLLRTILYLAILPILLSYRALIWFFGGKKKFEPVRIVDFSSFYQLPIPTSECETVEPLTQKDFEEELLSWRKGEATRDVIEILADLTPEGKIVCEPINIRREPPPRCKNCPTTADRYSYDQYRKDYGQTEISISVGQGAEWRLESFKQQNHKAGAPIKVVETIPPSWPSWRHLSNKKDDNSSA
jgi:hypothetical protein